MGLQIKKFSILTQFFNFEKSIMGCDGGTIPTRDELVKTAKRPEQKDKDSVRLYKWRHCALTQEPLDKPVVACELGRLYNKEAIIEKLLNAKSEGKTSESNTADHIKSLKDVKELQLEPNPAFKDKVTVGDGGYIDSQRSPWICPLTSQEMNGRFPFVFDWTKDKVSAIAEENLIILNPEERSEEEDLMFAKMEARRARIKAAKKAEKEKRKAEKSANGITNDNGEQPTKKVKIVEPKASSSTKSANESLVKNGHSKGVQNDPSKSEVYKSLFSSHHPALNKPKGNWVTFDPRYN